LNNLDRETSTPFTKCYQTVFDPPKSGKILAAINMIVPIRWLPFPKANREFVKANLALRRMLKEITEHRIAELVYSGEKFDGIKQYICGNKDLLTYMVEEKYLAPTDSWTKEELVEQVRLFMDRFTLPLLLTGSLGHELCCNWYALRRATYLWVAVSNRV
jgi:hypothetical protein